MSSNISQMDICEKISSALEQFFEADSAAFCEILNENEEQMERALLARAISLGFIKPSKALLVEIEKNHEAVLNILESENLLEEEYEDDE